MLLIISVVALKDGPVSCKRVCLADNTLHIPQFCELYSVAGDGEPPN